MSYLTVLERLAAVEQRLRAVEQALEDHRCSAAGLRYLQVAMQGDIEQALDALRVELRDAGVQVAPPPDRPAMAVSRNRGATESNHTGAP